MSVPFIPSGRPLRTGGAPILFGAPAPPPQPVYSGYHPSDLPSMSGWYDAGQLVMTAGPTTGNPTMKASGAPILLWRTALTTVVNQVSGGLADMSVSGSTPGINNLPPLPVPRLVGNSSVVTGLGGIYGENISYPMFSASTNAAVFVSPNIDAATKISVGGIINNGKGASWFRYVVLSSSSPVNGSWTGLGGTTYRNVISTDPASSGRSTRMIDVVNGVVQSGTNDSIMLFGSVAISAATLAALSTPIVLGPRWTHSFALMNNSVSGTATFWIDDQIVWTGSPPAGYPSSTSGSLYFGCNSSPLASFIFHEAVTAERVLLSSGSPSEQDIMFNATNSISKRWGVTGTAGMRGPRQGYRIIMDAQSNGTIFINPPGSSILYSGGFGYRETARYALCGLSVTLDKSMQGGGGVLQPETVGLSTYTGTISGNQLTVTGSVTGPALSVGAYVTGTGIPDNVWIQAGLSSPFTLNVSPGSFGPMAMTSGNYAAGSMDTTFPGTSPSDPLGTSNPPWPFGIVARGNLTSPFTPTGLLVVWPLMPAWMNANGGVGNGYSAIGDAIAYDALHNEGDVASGGWSYASKSVYEGGIRRLAQLARSTVGRTAAQMPFSWWCPMSYGTTSPPFTGQSEIVTMQREVLNDLLTLYPTENYWSFIRNTTAWNPDVSSQNPDGTIITTTSNGAHLDQNTTWVSMGRMYGINIARAFMAAGQAEGFTTIPTGLPSGGPVISAAVYQGSAGGQFTIRATIAPDATLGSGTNITIGQQGLNGFGWQVVVNPGAPTSVFQAVSATKIDATHIDVVFSGTYPGPTNIYLYMIHNSDTWLAYKTPSSSFTGAITGTVLTVTGATGSPLAVGKYIVGGATLAFTKINSLGTGSGGNGTYNLSGPSQSISATTMIAYAASFTAPIGLGNSPYDNTNSISKPNGWNIVADMGIAWGLNQPLQTSLAGTQIT